MNRLFGILTVLYCGGIFWLSSTPSPPDPVSLFPGQDKVAHAILYAGLTVFLGAGLRRAGTTPSFFQAAFPIFFAGIYGLSDETHQLFVPNRTFDLFDLAADIAGAALMQILIYAWLRRRKKKSILRATRSGSKSLSR